MTTELLIPKNINFFICLLFFRMMVTLPIFMFFMIFQLIPPVLLTPNNFCFHDELIPLPDRLGEVYQTFTKLDTVYSDFVVWWPQAAPRVLFSSSQKYGVHQNYLYYVLKVYSTFKLKWKPLFESLKIEGQ